MSKNRLLIIGASGLIGSNCMRHFKKSQDFELMGTYFSYPTEGCTYLNTLDDSLVENDEVANFNPTHILHTGALTHVDYCEQHPKESYLQTVVSTKNIVALARRYKALVIYLSTDYVFDGKAGPYDEEAQVNPLSVYGKHKLEAENIIKEVGLEHLILRVTNVYGDEERNKNFIARLWEAGKKGLEMNLKLPIDQYATPINAEDVAKAIERLIESRKTGIYHLASTDYLNRVQLANKVLDHFPEHKVTIHAVNTLNLSQLANRPLDGGLKAKKFFGDFSDFRFCSVDQYLMALMAK